MSSPRFENPNDGNTPSYAIWDFDPMSFQRWIDPLRDFYSQMEKTNDHTTIKNYEELFEEDIQQYIQHLLSMAPFSRSQVSLYNVICGTVHTTKDMNRLAVSCEWAEGHLPESFVALLNDAVRLGVSPDEALLAMKAYGELILSLAQSFLGNDRRRLATIFDAENIYNLFVVVAEPFVKRHHLNPWEKRQITGA